MKTKKEIKEQLYEELELWFDSAHSEKVDELIEEGYALEAFDPEEWDNATQEERDNKQVSCGISLKNVEYMLYDDIQNALDIISGTPYHLYDEENFLGDNIFRSYETNEYSKFQRDGRKLQEKIKEQENLNNLSKENSKKVKQGRVVNISDMIGEAEEIASKRYDLNWIKKQSKAKASAKTKKSKPLTQ